MDWSATIGVIIGAGVALGGIELRYRRESTTEHARWLRDQRLAKYSTFVQAFDAHMNAIHFNLAQYHEEEIPPDPLPSVGNTQQQLENALSELSLVSPPVVSQLAQQMKWATNHHQGSVGPYGDPYYSHWDKIHSLRSEFIQACVQNLDTPEIGAGKELDYMTWRQDWLSG